MVYVLSVKTPEAKSLGSATDANVTSEENGQGILEAEFSERVVSGGVELRLLSRS